MRIKEFARHAGVTVRTLHHYDSLGLLQPGDRSAAGYRLYGERELLRLQQISILKFIGCPLQEIKAILDRDALDLSATLRLQREALERRRNELDRALKAVSKAQAALERGECPDWEALKRIVEVIEMERNMEWKKSYFTPEQLTQLEERRKGDPTEGERGQQAWAKLIAEVEAAAQAKLDPSSKGARTMAQRWADLVNDFTRGDTEMIKSLNKLYADQKNWPSTHKRPYSDEADAFIKRAMKAGGISCM